MESCLPDASQIWSFVKMTPTSLTYFHWEGGCRSSSLESGQAGNCFNQQSGVMHCDFWGQVGKGHAASLLALLELSLPGCFILDPAPCCAKPELHRDATWQCFGDCPSWAHVSDVWVRKPPDDFSPQLSESPAAIRIFPAEAPNAAEQKQATLLCPVQIPEPSSVNINKIIIVWGHYLYRQLEHRK